MTVGHAQFWNYKKVTGNGNLTTKTIKTPTYDHIKSVGFMDIKLIQGNEGEITIKTDENIQEWIEIKVKKKHLGFGHQRQREYSHKERGSYHGSI